MKNCQIVNRIILNDQVLTTMFINVSNQLPKISYIKMMDIWLIFNLILPFTEVLLHTYKVSLVTPSLVMCS